MAVAFNTYTAPTYIYRATGGGVTFSANLAGTTFDYFTDTAVVNDAIYFSSNTTYKAISDLTLNVGTAMVGTGITITWEYFSTLGSVWRPIYNLVDGTNGFTNTGARTVQFPLQPNHATVTINGQTNRCWIRARISALTSISEGGANSTTKPTIGDGAITLSDYTDESPCTFNDIYNWVIANRPDIEATKGSAGLFKFNNATLVAPSGCTLRSTNEQIYFGNGCMTTANLQGIWFGEKVGTNGWKNQTSFYNCYRAPGLKLTSSSGSTLRMYGGIMGNFTNIVDGQTCGYSGRLGMDHGEWIGVYQESSGYFASAVCDRCTVDGDLITASTISSYPTNQQIADPTLRIWRHYGRTQNITTVKWSLPTTSLMDWAQHYANQGFDLNYTDCDPVFPAQTDQVKVCSRALGTATNINKVWFYDDSAGTYTDYTTQANNNTADDVPVSGDVGDIIYISPISTINSANFLALDFTIPAQSNDYEYEWEYYGNGDWRALDSSFRFDGTKNLTQSGTFYPTVDGNAGTNPQELTTINGISGTWTRVRITKKGTGSPVISRIRRRIQQGIYTGYIYEKYSYDLIIKDVNLNILDGVSVKITDALNNTVFNGKTNGSGNITQQKLIRKRTEFNAEFATETDYTYRDVWHSPYSIQARKYGYSILNMDKAVEGKSSEVGKMMVNSFITADEATASAYTGIDIDHTTNTITIDEDHTMQEVYDYCEAWAVANIEINEPFVASGGGYYSSVYNLVINSSLTGEGQIDIGDNNLILNGTSTLDILAGNGDHINVSSTISGYGYIV